MDQGYCDIYHKYYKSASGSTIEMSTDGINWGSGSGTIGVL